MKKSVQSIVIRILAVFSLAVLCSGVVLRADQQGRMNQENRQVVVEAGDTLWDLSAVFYNNPWFWPRIWYANPPIENPHIIFPGQIITLPEIASGTAPSPVLTPTSDVQPTPVTVTTAKVEVPKPKVKPAESPLVEEEPYQKPLIEEEIPFVTIDDEAANSRLDIAALKNSEPIATQIVRQNGEEEFLLDQGDLKDAPRFVKSLRDGTIFATGDQFWVNRGEGNVRIGQYFLAARQVHEIKSDRTKKSLGILMRPTGLLIVREIQKRISRVEIVRSFGELEMEDLLFKPEDLSLEIAAAPAQKQVDGQVVAMANEAVIASSWMRIFLDLGESNGIKRGDILTLYRKNESMQDVERGGILEIPNRILGSVVVVSTSTYGATGLILYSDTDIQLEDRVTTPGL